MTSYIHENQVQRVSLPNTRSQTEAADQDSRKSFAVYVFIMAGGQISWASRNNPKICLASIEAKYKALIASSKKAIWCRRWLDNINKTQTKQLYSTIVKARERSLSIPYTTLEPTMLKYNISSSRMWQKETIRKSRWNISTPAKT